jgi:hypothetical protein
MISHKTLTKDTQVERSDRQTSDKWKERSCVQLMVFFILHIWQKLQSIINSQICNLNLLMQDKQRLLNQLLTRLLSTHSECVIQCPCVLIQIADKLPIL